MKATIDTDTLVNTLRQCVVSIDQTCDYAEGINNGSRRTVQHVGRMLSIAFALDLDEATRDALWHLLDEGGDGSAGAGEAGEAGEADRKVA